MLNTRSTMAVRGAIPVLCATLLLASLSAPALASNLQGAIVAAEQRFGGQAFEAERYRENGREYIEVEVLSGNQIVEAVFNAQGTQLIEADTYFDRRRVARTAAALEHAKLSLVDAARIASEALGPAQVREATLRITRQASQNGKRFIVEVRSENGLFDVVINSRNGKVLRIIRD